MAPVKSNSAFLKIFFKKYINRSCVLEDSGPAVQPGRSDIRRLERSQSSILNCSAAPIRVRLKPSPCRIIPLPAYHLFSASAGMPVTIKLSASLLQYETQVPLGNLCLSSRIPPSPPECNKCPAIIYFNSLPSRTDEMDS